MSNGIKVTPLDIQQKRFHVGFRGYDQTEVNMFLDLVRDQMEELIREVTDLREFRQVYDDRRVLQSGEGHCDRVCPQPPFGTP